MDVRVLFGAVRRFLMQGGKQIVQPCGRVSKGMQILVLAHQDKTADPRFGIRQRPHDVRGQREHLLRVHDRGSPLVETPRVPEIERRGPRQHERDQPRADGDRFFKALRHDRIRQRPCVRVPVWPVRAPCVPHDRRASFILHHRMQACATAVRCSR